MADDSKRSGGANGRTRTIAVDALARVEGEGAMRVTIRDGRVTDVALRIYEPPRFFEGLLRGRAFTEAPDITARICGICPVAYQMSAVAAMEDACGVTGDGADPPAAPAALLRRVDREPLAPRLHAARARLPRLRRRDPDGPRPPRDRRARAAHEEDRQRDPARRRRPLRASRSTCCVGGFYRHADATPSWRRSASAGARPRGGAGDRSLDRHA